MPYRLNLLKNSGKDGIKLPGHVVFAHVCDCVGSPAQVFPPWEGAGLLQLRDLTSFPPPQDAEHLDHDDQSPQFPST